MQVSFKTEQSHVFVFSLSYLNYLLFREIHREKTLFSDWLRHESLLSHLYKQIFSRTLTFIMLIKNNDNVVSPWDFANV